LIQDIKGSIITVGEGCHQQSIGVTAQALAFPTKAETAA